MKLALLLLALAGPAAAQQADAGVQDDELQKELEKAIQADKAAAQQQGQGQGQAAPAAPPAATTASTGGAPQTLFRGAQSLNPDFSVILDGNFGYQRRAPQYLSGDDPDLHAQDTQHALGFAVQEVELAFSAIVDPYFKGEVYLTIPNLDGIEVEEAFATTTSLPWNLQIKAGSFRGAFGRQNGQHLHVQDFTRRPLINAGFLGEDGMRGPGAQVSWLAPLPFYLTLYAEAFSLGAPAGPASAAEPVGPVATFGGGSATDLTYVGAAKLFVPMGEEVSLYAGASAATGVSPGFLRPSDTGAFPGASRRSLLLGGDVYL